MVLSFHVSLLSLPSWIQANTKMISLHYHLSSICVKFNEVNPLCYEFTRLEHTWLPVFSSCQIFILHSSLKLHKKTQEDSSLLCDILCFYFLLGAEISKKITDNRKSADASGFFAWG